VSNLTLPNLHVTPPRATASLLNYFNTLRDSGEVLPALAQRKQTFRISEVILQDMFQFPFSLKNKLDKLCKIIISIIILWLLSTFL
jgi:hypothetical protein